MSKHDSDEKHGDKDKEKDGVRVKFGGVLLVCGECEERSSGPKKLGAKDVRKELKHGLGDARFRLRVLQTSCMGLCPKKAIALVAVGAQLPLRAAEVHDTDEAAAFARSVSLSFR